MRDPKDLLRGYFTQNGILLCNENRELPSLASIGGQWNDIVSLMENREVFYSKLYKGRVTYLSRAFYYHIKPLRQRENRLSPQARELLAFLRQAGPMGTEELKRLFPLWGSRFGTYHDELLRELLVTAVKRERTLNENWCTFLWAPSEYWEAGLSPLPSSSAEARRLLSPLLTERQITALLK